ncbi:MAG: 4Fe-4S dicluster domain-containing protein [Thermodesulfovibrionia bacterium]
MRFTRREFLTTAVKGAIATALPLSAFRLLSPDEAKAAIKETKTRWGFLVDTHKCVGCGFCVKACKLENEVPYDTPVSRTWVERYVVLKDGRMLADTPMAARDGFTEQRVQERDVKPSDIAKAFFVPKLCNHCDRPPCVQVCPVGATYQTVDGVVLVDRKWCIGCGYCIMACPYGARFFHPVYKVAEKCTFCYHRITKGLKPACVQACPFGARQLGNLKDPNDPVSITVLTKRVNVLKDEYGTAPQVYYIGLDEIVR